MTKDLAHNRRHDSRIRCFKRSHYTDQKGSQYRTEIINTSDKGARITTDLKVKVGDRVSLQEDRDGLSEHLVEIRWSEPLPGGVRMVAGVMRVAA